MRNPEVLPNYPNVRPELEPERDMCLRSLLAQAEGRVNCDYDREADSYLIEAINQAVVGSGESSDEYILACQQTGCEAICVMAVRGGGSEERLSVRNRQDLQVCIEEA